MGSDIPQREDFNNDNEIIDEVLTTHISDTTLHTTQKEKDVWNSPCVAITYYGDGTSSRVINLGTDFTPTWGFVFAIGKPTRVVDYENRASYNYSGLFSARGANMGLSLNDKKLSITQSSTPQYSYEYKSFNEKGVTYVTVVFR
jgi:hypothetical protein